MSDCNDLIEVVRERNEKIRMLEAQNREWQARYEALHGLYVTLTERFLQEFNKNKRAGE